MFILSEYLNFMMHLKHVKHLSGYVAGSMLKKKKNAVVHSLFNLYTAQYNKYIRGSQDVRYHTSSNRYAALNASTVTFLQSYARTTFILPVISNWF